MHGGKASWKAMVDRAWGLAFPPQRPRTLTSPPEEPASTLSGAHPLPQGRGARSRTLLLRKKNNKVNFIQEKPNVPIATSFPHWRDLALLLKYPGRFPFLKGCDAASLAQSTRSLGKAPLQEPASSVRPSAQVRNHRVAVSGPGAPHLCSHGSPDTRWRIAAPQVGSLHTLPLLSPHAIVWLSPHKGLRGLIQRGQAPKRRDGVWAAGQVFSGSGLVPQHLQDQHCLHYIHPLAAKRPSAEILPVQKFTRHLPLCRNELRWPQDSNGQEQLPSVFSTASMKRLLLSETAAGKRGGLIWQRKQLCRDHVEPSGGCQ